VAEKVSQKKNGVSIFTRDASDRGVVMIASRVGMFLPVMLATL
jgi:hypothetical protein